MDWKDKIFIYQSLIQCWGLTRTITCICKYISRIRNHMFFVVSSEVLGMEIARLVIELATEAE